MEPMDKWSFFGRCFSEEETGFGDNTIVLWTCLQPDKLLKYTQTHVRACTRQRLVYGPSPYSRFWKDRWILANQWLIACKALSLRMGWENIFTTHSVHLVFAYIPVHGHLSCTKLAARYVLRSWTRESDRPRFKSQLCLFLHDFDVI